MDEDFDFDFEFEVLEVEPRLYPLTVTWLRVFPTPQSPWNIYLQVILHNSALQNDLLIQGLSLTRLETSRFCWLFAERGRAYL